MASEDLGNWKSTSTSVSVMGYPSLLCGMMQSDNYGIGANIARRGLTCPLPGQLEVDVGVILVGYAGDPLFDKRPEWARGGTFMVYRRWEQDVEGFNNYLAFNGKRWREFVPPVPLEPGETLTDEQGAELFGARLFGRFKSVRTSFIHVYVWLMSTRGRSTGDNPSFR